jgi:hypothetical protein
VRGIAAGAHAVPPLADAGVRVRAAGNAFSFKVAGQPVRVVIHLIPLHA